MTLEGIIDFTGMTSRQEKIHSFAVLAYKKSKYLELCIQSLLEQTSPDCVYITTSTPSSFISNIADKYGIAVHVNPQKGSIAGDWNFALRQAKTKYVTLAHQDDIYFNKYATSIIKHAERAGDSVIIFCDYDEIINGKNVHNTLLLFIKRLLLLPFYIYAGIVRSAFLKRLMLSFGSPICCPSVTYNKNLIGDFSFNDDLKINVDWDAWLRLSKLEGSFTFIPKRLMAHRIHSEAETSLGIKNSQRQKEDFIMFQKLWGNKIANVIGRIYSLSHKINTDASNH